jgi:hypothetical protein
MGVILRVISSAALLIVAAGCAIVAWGAWERLNQHPLALVVAILVLVSCLWAIARIWGSSGGTSGRSYASVALRNRGFGNRGQAASQSEFELWLAKKIVESTELSDEQVEELRRQYEQEFGDGRSGR